MRNAASSVWLVMSRTPVHERGGRDEPKIVRAGGYTFVRRECRVEKQCRIVKV